MLFSLIHTETGSSSRFRHFAFEAHRLIQSLFGYFHHNPSLMEERSDTQRARCLPEELVVFAKSAATPAPEGRVRSAFQSFFLT